MRLPRSLTQIVSPLIETKFAARIAVAAIWSFLAVLQVACLAGSLVTAPTTVPTATMTTLPDVQREDGARRVNISVEGSLQNPAWSPDSNSLLFTRFSDGYNAEPADLLVIDFGSNSIRVLISDGSGNVNLPGSSWNPLTGKIVFSSSREPHDEIYLVDDYGSPGDEVQITDRANMVAYEPSLSPDGQWVVFESH